MNILLIEMGGSHIECVHSMVHFLYLSKCSIHLACNKKLVPSVIEKNKLSFLLELENEFSPMEQLKTFFTIRKYIRKNKIDTIIINTAEITVIRNLSFFLPAINCVGIVHNAKKLEQSFTFTKILSRRIKKFFVLGDYLLSRINPDPIFKVASFFPVYFPKVKQLTPIKPLPDFWVIVPGEAEQQRRDYVAFIDAVKHTPDLQKNIKFIFLGKYNLQQNFDSAITTSNWWKERFITFDDYLDYDTFHSYIQQANFILPLLKIGKDDFYGSSRISGSFNLGLGYKKPFLLPERYRENKDLANYSIYYTSMKELLLTIQQLSMNDFEQIKIAAAYENGPFKNIDSLAEKVVSFIAS
jgi:hypothetical protein